MSPQVTKLKQGDMYICWFGSALTFGMWQHSVNAGFFVLFMLIPVFRGFGK